MIAPAFNAVVVAKPIDEAVAWSADTFVALAIAVANVVKAVTFAAASVFARPEASVSAVAAVFAVFASALAFKLASLVARLTASFALAVTVVPLTKVIAPSLEVAVNVPAPLTITVPVAQLLVAVTFPAAAVVAPTLIFPAVPLVIVTSLPPLTATPAKPFATLISVVAEATTPDIAADDVIFNVSTPVNPETSALVIAAAAVRLTVSTFCTVTPAVSKVPVIIAFNVSFPAPPSIESKAVKVASPPSKEALNTSPYLYL